MCFWCGAKINGVKSSSSLSQTNNTGIMSGMLTTRALLWGLQILYRLVVYSFMQVVVLGFNLFHVNLPRSLCIIKKKKELLNLSGQYRNIQLLSNMPFISLNPSWCDPGCFQLSGQGGAGCQEFQELWPSCSRETAPAWQTDLHIERVDPSQLMRPTVWGSIISSLHPQPGWQKVMRHKVPGPVWYIVESNQSSAFLSISGNKLTACCRSKSTVDLHYHLKCEVKNDT